MNLRGIQQTLHKTAFATACLGAVSFGYAQKETSDEVEDPVYELEPFVVVATRTPLSLDRVSPSVSYISAEQMEFWQDQQLIDVLTRENGMTVVSNGGKGAQTSLFTRGTESNHTAFFIDGRRINSGFGNQYDLERIPVQNLDSVQVLRGASSVNYGSSGIGGVIDLRTRSGFDSDEVDAMVGGEIGSNDTYMGEASMATSDENWAVSIAASVLTTDNERENDAYDRASITNRIDFIFTENLSFELIGQYTETEKGLPNNRVSPKLEDEQDTTSWMISPGVKYATDELTVHFFYARSKSQIELSQIRTAYDMFFTPLGDFPLENEIEVETDELSLQADYSLSDDILLITGLLYRNDDASNSNLEFDPLADPTPYSNRFEQFGIFGQAIWGVTEALEIRGGVRWDDFSDFDSKTTGSVDVLYTFLDQDLTIFGKVATSYAPPGASDIAFDADTTSTPLEPEESISFEIGARKSFLEGDLVVTVLGFRNEIDELLDFVYDPSTFSFDSVNVEEATTEGVELQVDYAVTERCDIRFGYTYLRAVADYQDDPRTAFVFGSPDPASDVRLARRPRHSLNLGVSCQITDALRAGFQGSGYFDRKDIDPETYVLTDGDDYFVADLVVDWAIAENWKLTGRVENLFDKEYEPAAGFPALGRASFLGAQYSF